jgi:tRNA A58 N-methylase Trm61
LAVAKTLQAAEEKGFYPIREHETDSSFRKSRVKPRARSAPSTAEIVISIIPQSARAVAQGRAEIRIS